ncbi:MAG: type IV pilus assembly protein PilM [Solirubrobacterales bacterium]
MFTSTKQKSMVGLDIEAGSLAATEVSANGRVVVTRHGVAPLSPGVFREGEVVDAEELGSALKELFARHKLPRNVRLGIANQRVAVRTLHLPPIDNADELETAIRFQAQDHIPMPLDQAVLDWEVVGHQTLENGERRIEVVAVAARRDMLGSVMEALGRAGLRPVGIDLSAFGMIRALAAEQHAAVGAAGFVTAPVPYEDRYGEGVAPGTTAPTAVASPAAPARLYCNLGDVVNLAVAQGKSCLFTRISPFGVEGIAQKLAERRQLTLEHARQWLGHVGLESPTDEIEGNPETVSAAREALAEGAAKLVDELRLSLEFYGTQEGAVGVEGVVACGPGTTIPGLVERLQRDLGFPCHVGRPRALEHLDEASAARLTLSYGLALEG